jgi:hypothetical protein
MAKLKKNPRKNHKHPIAVTIIFLLVIGEILLRLYWLVDYAMQTQIWLNGIPGWLWEEHGPTTAGLDFAAATFRLLWVLVAIAVLIGLLTMRRWSWVALVFWVSVSLSIGILHYFYRSLSAFNPSDYAVMAADMVLVFALNQFDVQRIYEIRRDDVEHLG